MAGFSALLLSVLAIYAVGVRAEGEVDILHTPNSLKWTGHARLPESLIKEIFSASLGLSVEETSEWSGLSIVDPFNTPEAVVEVYIDGVKSIGDSASLSSVRYSLALDQYEPDTFSALSHRIHQRTGDAGNTLVNLVLSNQNDLNEYSDQFGKIKILKEPKRTTEYLKPSSVDEDAQFLQELQVLNEITEKVKNGAIAPDNVPDYYQFRFLSLHPLSDMHGIDSDATKEAKSLLREALVRLSAAFSKAYDGSVLVTAVCSDSVHTRRAARSILETEAETTVTTGAPVTTGSTKPSPSPTPLASAAAPPASAPITMPKSTPEAWNVADTFDEDYPVIFNILLWFGIVFAFSLIAIVYAIMDMDPGRDSIIYRMTSNRMKKDN